MPIIAFAEDDEDIENTVQPLTPAEQIRDTAETLRTHIAYFIGNPNYKDMATVVRIMERYEEQYTKHYKIQDEFTLNQLKIDQDKKLKDTFYNLDRLIRANINWRALDEYDERDLGIEWRYGWR